VLEILEQAVKKRKRPTRTEKLAALAQESARVDREGIRQWQALPPGNRTNFLRKRVGLTGSAL
jgi:hypothetical protein